jgi:hypothetical protein
MSQPPESSLSGRGCRVDLSSADDRDHPVQPFELPASIAGLPRRRAIVCAGPPLFCRGPRLGSVFFRSPVLLKLQGVEHVLASSAVHARRIHGHRAAFAVRRDDDTRGDAGGVYDGATHRRMSTVHIHVP